MFEVSKICLGRGRSCEMKGPRDEEASISQIKFPITSLKLRECSAISLSPSQTYRRRITLMANTIVDPKERKRVCHQILTNRFTNTPVFYLLSDFSHHVAHLIGAVWLVFRSHSSSLSHSSLTMDRLGRLQSSSGSRLPTAHEMCIELCMFSKPSETWICGNIYRTIAIAT